MSTRQGWKVCTIVLLVLGGGALGFYPRSVKAEPTPQGLTGTWDVTWTRDDHPGDSYYTTWYITMTDRRHGTFTMPENSNDTGTVRKQGKNVTLKMIEQDGDYVIYTGRLDRKKHMSGTL